MKTISVFANKNLSQLYEEGSKIKVLINKDKVLIQANKEGCLELAKHFLYLALDKNFIGYHMHLDESNSLEEGSNEMILEVL